LENPAEFGNVLGTLLNSRRERLAPVHIDEIGKIEARRMESAMHDDAFSIWKLS
jgi:hypothetical protein